MFHPWLRFSKTRSYSSLSAKTSWPNTKFRPAFCTNPALSLCAESGILPLRYQRLNLTAKFLTTILEHPRTTTYNHIFHPLPSVHVDNNLRTHLEQQLNRTFKFETMTLILPATPPWLYPTPPIINLSPTQSLVSESLFQELIHS